MKKIFLQIIETLSIILVGVSFVFFVKKIVDTIKNYSPAQSISLSSTIIIYSIMYIFIICLLFIVVIIVSKKLKKNNFFTIHGFFQKKAKKHKILTIVYICLFFLILLISSVILLQDFFIYHPNNSIKNSNRLIQSNMYEKIIIETNDGSNLDGWFRYINKDAYTIIYFGGNGESASLFFGRQDERYWNEFIDYNFIMVDYPGYGYSQGKTTEKNIYKMSLEVFDYVYNLDKIDNSKIIVFGFSLGTGVATYVAQNRDFSRLILIAPYTSMIDVFNSKAPILIGPIKLAFNSKFDSLKRTSDINEKTLIITSTSDEIISYKLSVKLSKKIKDSLLFYSIGSKHNQYLLDLEVINKINDFINK